MTDLFVWGAFVLVAGISSVANVSAQPMNSKVPLEDGLKYYDDDMASHPNDEQAERV